MSNQRSAKHGEGVTITRYSKLAKVQALHNGVAFYGVEVKVEPGEVIVVNGSPSAQIWCQLVSGEPQFAEDHYHDRIVTQKSTTPIRLDNRISNPEKAEHLPVVFRLLDLADPVDLEAQKRDYLASLDVNVVQVPRGFSFRRRK